MAGNTVYLGLLGADCGQISRTGTICLPEIEKLSENPENKHF